MCVSTDRSPRSHDLSTVFDRPNTVIVVLNLTLISVGESSLFCFELSLGLRFDPQSKCSIKSFKQGFLVLETHLELREEVAIHNKQ